MILANPTQKQDISREELYKALLRSLRRRKGFGLVFLQCSPGEAKRLLPQLMRDLPQKNIGVLDLTEPIDNLYEKISDRSDCKSLNILFIQGLEKSLESDIKPGYGGDGDYYNLSSVPRILSHLNQQRERFRDNFGNICFVFILPAFAIKYFIRRAPDFFDWGTGTFEFPDENLELYSSLFNAIGQSLAQEHSSKLKDVIGRLGKLISVYQESQEYQKHQQALSKIGKEISVYQKNQQCQEYYAQGLRLNQLGEYKAAIANFDKALQINPAFYDAWYLRGYALRQLGQPEAAIASYDKALELKPDDHNAWNLRGIALHRLGEYKAAIASYDKALELKFDDHNAWNLRGMALSMLGQYEHAISSHNESLKLKPDHPETFINRGIALHQLGDYEAAIASYDKALELKPDYDYAWYKKACCYAKQSKLEPALENLKKALEYSTNEYQEMVKIDPNFDFIRDNEQFQSLIAI